MVGHTACDFGGMTKSTSALETPLRAQLDKLAAFEPTESPVLSLYLDMRPNENGRRTWEPFLRKVPATGSAVEYCPCSP